MNYPETDQQGRPRTPYAVWCDGPDPSIAPGHGLVYLTHSEYMQQLSAASVRWKCPYCRYDARWEDDNYYEMTQREEKKK